MRCRDLMTTTVHACRESDTVKRCGELMRDERIGFVPVLDGEQHVVGVVTDRDLAIRVLAADWPPTTRVRQVMTPDVVTCRPDDEIRVAEERMTTRLVTRVPIVDSSRRCVGILSLADVFRVEESRRAGDVLRAVAARESVPPLPFR